VLHQRRDGLLSDKAFLGAYWRCAWRTHGGRAHALSNEIRGTAIASAREVLGRLRASVRDGTDPAAPPEVREEARCGLQADFQYLEFAVQVLAKLGSVWAAMRALLLLLRALKTVAVASDLRYWPEPGRDPPPPTWSLIVHWLTGVIHSYARFEQATDPELAHLRTEFATFLLDRLKTRDDEQDKGAPRFVEEDPIWRECTIHAFRALRVNPRAGAHRLLHWIATNESEAPGVRKAAKVAAREAKHGEKLPAGMSPRRAIFLAVLWILQAHARAVGVKLDEDGVKRTRDKIAQRTREIEQMDGGR
jgi:hypothetical protein